MTTFSIIEVIYVKFVGTMKLFIHGIQLLQCAKDVQQFIIDYVDLNVTIAVQNV